MNDANIPSGFELEHVYTQLMKRLRPLISVMAFDRIHIAMREHRYGDALVALSKAIDNATYSVATNLTRQFHQSHDYLIGEVTTINVEALEVIGRQIGEYAKLLRDWRAAEELFGGASAVQEALAEFDTKFEHEDLTRPLVA